MRLFRLLTALLLFCGGYAASAQTTTIILLRHAEKEAVAPGTAMSASDPNLSPAGRERAAKLLSVLKDYSPDIIYTTPFLRTRQTVQPLAEKHGKQPETYDPRQLAAFAESLKAMAGKTIVVAGHSNTTPALVNLLIDSQKYPALDESVYNKLWIVTIKDGKAEEKIVEY